MQARYRSWIRRAGSGRGALPWALMSLLLGAPGAAEAQQPTGTVTLTGVVVDATTGAPIPGAFLSMGDQGPRGIADPEGRFRIVNVPSGNGRLVVQRFGYVETTVALNVADPAPPILVRMEVDPLAIEGLTVTGGVRVALSGVVLDAATEEPIPWASLLLTRDATRQDGRGSSDAQGVFLIPNVPTGGYLLRVDRLGYVSQFVVVAADAPPEPIELRLAPDSALRVGLERMTRQIESRRRGTGFSSQGFGEVRLRTTHTRGMREFLENDAMLDLVPCSGRGAVAFSNDCLLVRGNPARVVVFIDEVLVFGLLQLGVYHPSELFAVELFQCGGLPVIRAYTYPFMERVARRPQQFFDPCRIPPLPMQPL